jgi:hypothetical protein
MSGSKLFGNLNIFIIRILIIFQSAHHVKKLFKGRLPKSLEKQGL